MGLRDRPGRREAAGWTSAAFAPPVLPPHLAGISEAARKKRAMRSGKLCRDDRIATVLGLSTLHWTVAAPSLVSDQVSRGPSQYTVEGTSYDRVLGSRGSRSALLRRTW